MQKRVEQNTNIKEGNYYLLLEFHALGDHQSDDRLERETRVTSNNFLLSYLYICIDKRTAMKHQANF